MSRTVNLTLKMAILASTPTQWEFAREVGLTEFRLSGIIHGRVVPTPAERARIAQALGVAERRLFPASTAARNPASTAGKKER